MHSDSHHRRPFRALADELVETHRQRVQKVAGAPEAGSHEEAAVVVRLRVRDDKERTAEAMRVEGHVVGRAIGVIDEAALLDEELAGVLAGPAAAVPAERALSEDSLVGRNRASKVFALLVSREPPELGPPPAMAKEIVVVLAHPVGDSRVELERDGGGRDRDRDRSRLEDARQPPNSGTTAVLVMGLGATIALRRIDARIRILAPAVVAIVVPEDRVLRSLLVDEDDVDDESGAIRPGEDRREAAVADEVARADPLRDHRAPTIGSANPPR